MPDGSTFPKNNEDFTITTDQLLADIASANDTANSVAEENGLHRSNIKSILERRGYHKKAFKDFRDMEAMSDSKFTDYYRTFAECFDAYRPVAERRISDMLDKAELETSEMESDLRS